MFKFYLQIYDMICALQRQNVSLPCCSGVFPSRYLSSTQSDVSFIRLTESMNDRQCDNNRLFYYSFNGKCYTLSGEKTLSLLKDRMNFGSFT